MGKSESDFQGLVNSAQVKEQYSDIGRITQIPHGFLSAVTISRNEFKKLSELFSEADFRPFITAVYHHHDREDIYEGDEIQEYAVKYYAEQISEYLKKDIKNYIVVTRINCCIAIILMPVKLQLNLRCGKSIF